MFEHFVIMSSSYDLGKRIALHYAYPGGMDYNEIEGVLDTLKSACDDRETFSTHYICTDSESWESIVSYDAFFAGVYVAESIERFVHLIRKDFALSGYDVAKYILSKHECTHLVLEKLTYLCFADYLCKYGKKLYEDKIYAFTYGPVVDTVYDKYNHHKGDLSVDIEEVVIRSRILILPDGMERLKSIDETLEKYTMCSASELIDITHAPESPWSMKDSKKAFQLIDDDIIMKHHIFEEQYFAKRFGT